MINNRIQLAEYAEEICIPQIEKAINNIVHKRPYTVIDHIGFEHCVLEELLRPLWGIAPLLNKNTYYISVCGEKQELTKAIRDIIIEGSREESEYFFARYASNRSEILYANQMITEFAGYCFAVTLAPDALWEPYTQAEREQVAAFVKKWAVLALKYSWRNNHFWFPILAVTALEKLGIDCGDVVPYIQDGFSVLDTMYISDGWYKDGAFGNFDFYLAWSHHVYPHIWSYLARGTKLFDEARSNEYKRRTEEYFKYYSHLFDVDGSTPAYGRSLAYRFAQSAFFAAAAFADCNVDYGVARRILLKNVSYFKDNTIVNDDRTLPPGYLYQSEAIVENYTSSGGAYWCAKAFMVLALEEDHPFWQASEAEMPSEKGDYLLKPTVDGINILVEHNKISGISLYKNVSSYYHKAYGGRFNDMASYYNKFVYNSRSGFAISSADNTATDSVISLETEDGTLVSRRFGFIDLGYVDGVLVSEHTPFANDKATRIVSYVYPIGDGYHLRAHKVVLSQPYKVCEGGFSVGSYNDGTHIYVTKEYAAYDDGISKFSKVYTVADTAIEYGIQYNQPGMHILAPQSAYPVYKTKVLDAGEYHFASVFLFADGERPATEPLLRLENGVVSVEYNGIVKRIEVK